VAGGLSAALAGAGATVMGAAWEARRRAYAAGLAAPRRVPARVVSVGNLTLGGTGKTTLTLHLARAARARGLAAAVVCRRYRPGPSGRGDEELLYAAALGEAAVHAGRVKRALAREAAAAGAGWIVVDDGFSHWGLARDLDIVLLDARDPWGGGRLVPAGRLREPLRALQRAGAVVVSRLGPGEDAAPLLAAVRRAAPAALPAAARHRVTGVRALAPGADAGTGRVRVVTATGSPEAVRRSAAEAGLEVVGLAGYRDHHAFSAAEARREVGAAARERAAVLLTAKDAVRWPLPAGEGDVRVLEVAWEWVAGGEAVERLAWGEEGE
jgi:tetraacyldisaccharide 4'-kinase